jgi:hypothetical protein
MIKKGKGINFTLHIMNGGGKVIGYTFRAGYTHHADCTKSKCYEKFLKNSEKARKVYNKLYVLYLV